MIRHINKIHVHTLVYMHTCAYRSTANRAVCSGTYMKCTMSWSVVCSPSGFTPPVATHTESVNTTTHM